MGEGGFGTVYKGKYSNMDVAIKEMHITYSEFKAMDAEMTFMAKMRHPCIVSMWGIAIEELRQNKLHCCILMEMMVNDLDSFIFKDPQAHIQRPFK